MARKVRKQNCCIFIIKQNLIVAISDYSSYYSMSKEKYDVVQMAKMLNVNINLVLIKLQELNKLGYDFRVPCEADSFFFRKPKTLTSNELN